MDFAAIGSQLKLLSDRVGKARGDSSIKMTGVLVSFHLCIVKYSFHLCEI